MKKGIDVLHRIFLFLYRPQINVMDVIVALLMMHFFREGMWFAGIALGVGFIVADPGIKEMLDRPDVDEDRYP